LGKMTLINKKGGCGDLKVEKLKEGYPTWGGTLENGPPERKLAAETKRGVFYQGNHKKGGGNGQIKTKKT